MGENEYVRHDNQILKTVGLILRMMKTIWHSSRVVIMDSGFCVLKGLVELAKRGVYGSTVVKKRRYWPKYINGDEIDQYFQNKQVGYQDYLPGLLDNVPFHLFCLKEEDYVMKMISTYGTTEKKGVTKRYLQSTNEIFLSIIPKYLITTSSDNTRPTIKINRE